MKLIYSTLLFCTFFAASNSFAQIAWNEIPPIVANPAAGQTSPQSYDVSIAADGRIYGTYINNTAGTYEIVFKEYVPGTGWSTTPIFTEQVYSGFEAIHSFKNGSDIMVMVKHDDASTLQFFTIYNISAGTVTNLGSPLFADLPDGADYRAVLSEDGTYIYMLHMNDTGSFLELTQIDWMEQLVVTLTVPTGAASAYNYDLVEHQDTVYIGLTHESATAGEYRTYLHKTSYNMYSIDPHHPGNTDGQMGMVGPSAGLMGLVMFKDQVNHNVRIETNDGTNNFQYVFYPATLTTTGPASLNYYSPNATVPSASVSFNGGSLYLGVVNDMLANPYKTRVIYYNYATDQASYQSASDFNSVGAQSSNLRLAYNSTLDQGIISLYNGSTSSTRFYLSNHEPTLSSQGNTLTQCPTVYSTLVDDVQITDVDGDPITIISVTGTNSAMFPAGSINPSVIANAGNTSTFDLVGTASEGGSTTATIVFTDGIDTVTATVNINITSTIAPPTFTQSTINICSDNGMIDMSNYVTTPGGSFGIAGNTTMFNGVFFNSATNAIAYETQSPLSYSLLSNGCALTASAMLILHDSPDVNVTTAPTSCGTSTGSAVATISGGTVPYLLQSWSSGQNAVTSVSNLSQGTYTFTVKDANACQVIREFTIVPTGVDIVPTITNSSCYGSNNGSITAALNGFTAPVSMIWSSGYSVPTISNLVPGTYSLTVTDAANCVYTESFTVTQPTEITASQSITSPSCGNTDGSMMVSSLAGGTGGYTVVWSSGGNGTTEPGIGYGVYSATITDNSGCQTIKTFYVSEQNSGNLYGNITGTMCGTETGEIDVTPALPSGTNVQAISWSSGEVSEDIFLKASGTYVCTLTTDANCHAIKGWNIPIVAPDPQPICVVTVDSLTSTNLVVWEKVQPVGIHHYNIYRETSIPGEYILIDTVEATNISLFNDVVASPIARSWSYKISAVNGCNTEGQLSAQHRTMHLSAIYAGTNQTQISWNAYEGTAYNSFILWKYTDAGLWEEVATLPGTQTLYIDNTDFSTPGLDYMVELELLDECSALVYRAQDFNTTRSNKDKGNFILGQGTGDSNNDISEMLLDEMEIYPNPTTDLLTITQTQNNDLTIRVVDPTGKVISVKEVTGISNQINLSELVNGTYLVEIELNGAKKVTRIVKI